jgi:two-component system cell cycle sensor histidine kinase/response regulator CckA
MNVASYEEIQKMGRSRCILLVDDEEVVLDVGTMMLEKIGYQVLGARNSAEAVEIFKQSGNEIDLVLLDLKLPDESGAETGAAPVFLDTNLR